MALVGDAATQQLASLLTVLFAEHGIRLELWEGPFDAIELQAYDSNSELYRFAPDFIAVMNVTQALRTRYYRRTCTGAEFLENENRRITSIWDALREHTPAAIIQSNFALPIERVFGNFDHKVPDSLYSIVSALNQRIAEGARSRNQLFINDVDSIASHVGRRNWYDNRFWNMYKSLCALEHLPLVGQNIIDVALSIRGRAVKCVVLDLDNTLWGGVIGDDGVDGIALSAHGDGESFHEFQSFLLELQKRGILLAVCSKNNLENALKPFLEHSEMVLRREHISVFVANWEDKAQNIRRIRETLNIGFDTMVFLDDNPFERNLVRSLLPDVIVPELPEEPAEYVRAICELNLFETSSFSAEDSQRTEMYRQKAEREEMQSSFGSVEEYLQSLETEITIGRFEQKRIPRIAQLMQRSNQFNLTTRRRSEAECEELIQNPACYPIFAELKDRLGNHGLISIVVAWTQEEELFLSDWLMSCRVLKRGVEQFLMNHCVEYAASRGKKWVVGEYRPTPKNAMVKNFYQQFGFEPCGGASEGSFRFRLDVAQYRPAVTYMNAIGVSLETVAETAAEIAANS
ncbi:MAG: HAD-IIIC family phosphatase [Bryobacteraceae bacterium]